MKASARRLAGALLVAACFAGLAGAAAAPPTPAAWPAATPAARGGMASATAVATTGAASTPGTPVAPHTVPDTLAQRVVACTSCHGKEGVATREGYLPRIAGKPAGYLYNQLMHFREGRRNNAAMVRLTDPLSESYLREIAAHFAALDLPYAPPPPLAATAAQLERGALLVKQGDNARHLPPCTSCHGAAMTGVLPAIPGLLGLPKDYLLAQLGAWRTGLRRAQAPDCMGEISRRLSDEDLSAVATYLALQPVPRDARPQPAGLSAGGPRSEGTAPDQAPRPPRPTPLPPPPSRLPLPLPLACGGITP